MSNEIQPTLLDEEVAAKRNRRPRHPEVQLLDDLIKDIEELEPDARVRVIAYLSSLYRGQQ